MPKDSLLDLFNKLVIAFTPKDESVTPLEESAIREVQTLMNGELIPIDNYKIKALDEANEKHLKVLNAEYKSFAKTNKIKNRKNDTWIDKIVKIRKANLKDLYAKRVDMPIEIASTKSERTQANREVEILLKRGEPYSTDELMTLSKYTGSGGTEFYTPPELAKATWGLLGSKDGDRILDPSSGTGIFARTTPNMVDIDSVEISVDSGRINQALNPHAKTEINPFEVFATNNPNAKYDHIITNVPFGVREKDFKTMDAKYSKVSDNSEYFILRSLDMLKEGGRGVYITSVSTAERTSDAYSNARLAMVKKASFVGGYRLPSIMFSETGTEVVTDILVFEKHPNKIVKQIEGKDYQIESLNEALQVSNENTDFLNGNYFIKRPKQILGIFRSMENAKEDAIANGETLHHHLQKDTVTTDLTIDEVKASLGKKLSPNVLKNTFGYGELVSLVTHSAPEQELKLIESVKTRMLNEELAIREGQGLGEKDFNELYSLTDTLQGIKPSAIFVAKKIAIDNKIDGNFQPLLNLFSVVFDPMQSVESTENYIDDNQLLVNSVVNATYLKKLKKSFRDNKLKSSFDELLLYLNGKGEEVQTLMQENPTYGVVGVVKNGVRTFPIDSFTEEKLLNEDITVTEEGVISTEDYFNSFVGVSYEDALLTIGETEKPKGISDDLWEKKQSQLLKKIDDFKFTKDIKKLKFSIGTIRQYLSNPSNRNMDVENLIHKLLKESGNDLAGAFRDRVMQNLATNRDMAGKLNVTEAQFKESIAGYQQVFRIILRSKAVERADLRDLGKHIPLGKEGKLGENYNFIRGIYLTSFTETTELLNFAIKETWLNDVEFKVKLEDSLDKQSIIKSTILISSNMGSPMEELRGDVSDELIQMAHVHQNEDARHFSTSLKDTIAQGTGVGKSITMLLTSVNALNNGNSKRVLVLTPNGVLAKLEDEFRRFLTDKWQDRVIVMRTATITEDLAKIRQSSKIRIIIAPHSIVDSIRLKEDTVSKLARLEDGVTPTRFYQLVQEYPTFKNAKVFFENMGIDTLLIDEQQNFKNGVSSIGLRKATHSPSASHTTLLYIAEYIRQQRGSNNGVVCVTATPLTNNPSEILNNIVLSGGYKDKWGNPKRGFESKKSFVDGFIKDDLVVTDKVNGHGVTESKTFVGFSDFSTLKEHFDSSVRVRTAESEQARSGGKLNVRPPVTEESATVIPTHEIAETFSTLADLNERYKTTIAEKSMYQMMDSSEDKFSLTRSLERTVGETFGFISRVKSLSNGKSFAFGYTPIVIKEGTTLEQLKTALKGMKYFNFLLWKDKDVLTFDELVDLPLRNEALEVSDEDVNKLAPDFIENRELKNGNKTVFNAYTTDDESIRKITDRLIKLGICEVNNLFITSDFPKYEKLLDNMVTEYERKETAKQIVFSDKPVLTQRVISQMVRNGSTEKRLPNLTVHTFNKSGGLKQDKSNAMDLQNAFNNALTPDVMIFGIAGITGVDFNDYVSAVHLMNIPNTPDINEQATGRGARQGNKISSVTVYKYFMDGTFDEFMDKLVAGKSDWINQLMGSDEVEDEVDIDTSSSEQIIANAVQMFGNEKIPQTEMIDKYIVFQADQKRKDKKLVQSIKIKMQIKSFDALMTDQLLIEDDKEDYIKGEKKKLYRNASNFAFRQRYLKIPDKLTLFSYWDDSENFLSKLNRDTFLLEKSNIISRMKEDDKRLLDLADIRKERDKIQAKLRIKGKTKEEKEAQKEDSKKLNTELEQVRSRIYRLSSPIAYEVGAYNYISIPIALNSIMKDAGDIYQRDITAENEIMEALKKVINIEFDKIKKEMANINYRVNNIDDLVTKRKNELLVLKSDDNYDSTAMVEYDGEDMTIQEFLNSI